MFAPSFERELNRDCFCVDVDAGRVWSAVAAAGGAPAEPLQASRPHLFSTGPAFLSAAELAAMEATVRAVEAAAEVPAMREALLAWAPAIARFDPGPRGAFMGYDFHLTPAGPRLIEVNTNAGGAFLNAILAQSQTAGCVQLEAIARGDVAAFEARVWDMFEAEWRRQGRSGQPASVAIVDEAPQDQYLYPEFLLARDFFERRGVRAIIADPRELQFRDGRLAAGRLAIDMVYNRLVDFAFAGPETAALREAHLAGATVVTPNPRNHALLADKRNLTILSDPDRLAALGVDPGLRQALAALPATRRVTAENAESLWADRRSLFFKPAAGHGGKAVYRGDKITRGAWEGVLRGEYVAQAFAAPSERSVRVGDTPEPRKMDVRLYAYGGETLLVAARLYQGQTTNFRTPGGGFAPVIVLPPATSAQAA